ncbi:MAG: hypothetical protein LAT51_11970, partial [Flavobacteriaceae bacterium]|nr:hypothetical protein [Flavobacteriaceae bacterium]
LAGVFGLALMGGVMLNTQEAEAQEISPDPGGTPSWDLGLCFSVSGGMEAGCYFLSIDGPCNNPDPSCK